MFKIGTLRLGEVSVMLEYSMAPRYGISVFSILLLFITASCGHSDVAASESRAGDSLSPAGGGSVLGDVPSTDPAITSDPNYKNALALSQMLFNKPAEEDTKRWKEECKAKKPANPFCPSFKVLNKLKVILARKSRIYSPPPTKPLNPTVPHFEKGVVTNLTQLRKAQVPNLLKGLLVLPLDQLKNLGEISLKVKRCPNNLSVAVGATLEDYLPNDVDLVFLAKLYAQAAHCSKKMPLDREHFLTRAGLYYLLNKDPKSALGYFSSVNPVDALSGRAIYWLYRTKQALGDSAGATQAFNRLLSHHRFSFHALIGAQLEKKDIGSVMTQPLALLSRSKRVKKANGIVENAENLKKLGLDATAAVLVDWLLDEFEKLEPEFKIYLTKLGDDHARVTSMPSILLFHPELISKESMELDFPRAFFPLFDKHKGNLDPYLLLAVARRESSFNAKAVSPANAQGLLQLNPDTARTLVANEGEQSPLDLLDPDNNIRLGSKYLSDVLGKMGGSVPKALAVYNAGEPPVHTWEKRYLTADPILWMDLIPYRETRDYVANVLSSYYWYLRIYENSENGSKAMPLPSPISNPVPNSAGGSGTK